jgi:serine/threonine protein phosphatase PrpC/ribosomal protein L39E
MARKLTISVGQHSDKGRKELNQDFHGALIPEEPLLGLKGIAIALADGISSSSVSQIAAESAIKSFLTDYYCTSEAWSVKTSAQRVIAATNSWLHAQTRRSQYAYERDRGYVCTLSVLVLKGSSAHIFHVGDSRIYRLSGQSLEQLTDDHRVSFSAEQSYLSRALGANPQVEIDYQMLPLARGDVFVLVTDGVYEHVGQRFVIDTLAAQGEALDEAARLIAAEAHARGSADNLTVQIVRVDELPSGDASEALGRQVELPLPPLLEPRMLFDGYRIVRQLHASSRSHIYLAVDLDDESLVALKIPSLDLRSDEGYLRRFMLEEWVARRLDSAHVLKPRNQSRVRNYLYVANEFVEGRTLAQWMIDNPKPDLETVRGIVEQIGRGLLAFHRKEMLHQDLRPANIMIDATGTVKIIDFGSTRVAGVAEASPSAGAEAILGTVQYSAPEYLLGEGGSPRSDLYSLGVIAYEMLTGRLPYGAEMAKARTRSQQRKVPYATALDESREIPAWIDVALRKAVDPEPAKRYGLLSEFVYDLRNPNRALMSTERTPLIQKNPLLFWKLCSLALAVLALCLLSLHVPGRH